VYLLLEIQPGEFPAPVSPSPVDVAFVVDQSASMCIPILPQAQFQELARLGAASETIVDGIAVWHFKNVPESCRGMGPRNIDYVKQALRRAMERLSPLDRFSVIAFARDTCVLIDGEPGQSKQALTEKIERLESLPLGNETHLAAGMQRAYEHAARHSTRDRVHRMIILTDGFTLDAPQCRFFAEKAAQDGISISTMGLGVEFNEELLISIADASGGNAYFIRDPKEIPVAIDRELAGVQDVVLRGVNLKMNLMPGVDLRRVYRARPMISDLGSPRGQDASLDFSLGEMGRSDEIAFLFQLVLPTRPPGSHKLAHLLLEYRQPGSRLEMQRIRHDCAIRYQAGVVDLTPNPRVLNIARKQSLFRLQTRALEDAARGDITGATVKLRTTATRLINMGENQLAEAALNEAASLEKCGQMSPAGTKRLRYDTRRLT
jgi:hypothetical protein